jgi:hypothetical protein
MVGGKTCQLQVSPAEIVTFELGAGHKAMRS